MEWKKFFKVSLWVATIACIFGSVGTATYFLVTNAQRINQKGNQNGMLENMTLNDAKKYFGENNIEKTNDGYVLTGFTLPGLENNELVIPSKIDGSKIEFSENFKNEFRNCFLITNVDKSKLILSENAYKVKTLYLPFISGNIDDYDFMLLNPTISNYKIIFPNLEKVVLNNDITQLRPNMFVGCSKLTSINFPTSMSEIPAGFLQKTGIEELFIPSTIKKINYNAFTAMNGLKKVDFSEDITKITIDSQAFSYCNNLKTINFRNVNSIIDESLFANDAYGKFWWLFNNITTNDKIEVYLTTALNDEIQNKVTHYNYDVSNFNFNISSFSNLTIDQAISTFGEGNVLETKTGYEVVGYTKPQDLSNIFIPSTINGKNIVYTNNFSQSFKAVMAEKNDSSGIKNSAMVNEISISNLGKIDNYNFLLTDAANGNNKIIFNNIEKVILDDKISQLPSNMFFGCSKLANINFPSSMSEIPSGFLKQSGIVNLYIPPNIKKIHSDAFSATPTLRSIDFSNGIEDIIIDSHAFSFLNNLDFVNFRNINSIVDVEQLLASDVLGENWWIFHGCKFTNRLSVYLNEALNSQLTKLIKAYNYDVANINFEIVTIS